MFYILRTIGQIPDFNIFIDIISLWGVSNISLDINLSSLPPCTDCACVDDHVDDKNYNNMCDEEMKLTIFLSLSAQSHLDYSAYNF